MSERVLKQASAFDDQPSFLYELAAPLHKAQGLSVVAGFGSANFENHQNHGNVVDRGRQGKGPEDGIPQIRGISGVVL